MKIKIYIIENCLYCTLSIQLLKEKKIQYNKENLKENTQIFDHVIKTYNHKTAPLIFINEKFIGGYNELKKILN